MKKFYRSQNDQKLAGICGALGEIYQIDANLIRIGVVFLTMITHFVPGIVAYVVAWMILPEGETD